MRRFWFVILFLSATIIAKSQIVEQQANAFVSEAEMMDGLMQMLADFTVYMKADYQPCVEPNSMGEVCGCFRGENTMGPDERGVRPNADLGMVCAFLLKYGKEPGTRDKGQAGKGGVRLPDGVTWADLEKMAMESLVFAYSTHKANRLKVCAGGRYWGSTSRDDHVWESSLWAMSVAYSAFFLWERLTATQRDYVYRLLKAECNYELERDIPTGYAGDTKAEENGWEADVLAATLGLFPNDTLASRWFQRLREFAVNSYSQRDDANNHTVVDPHYDQATVAQLYRGQNLYDDFTLQNHNYFHTSYQNVVVQELGEAALALKLFQQQLYGTERWHTATLKHNNSRVMNDVLYWLALADGELAMPNGNDWSLFLYDQITSYSTCACFLSDPHALMLENQAYKMIRERQKTTPDGSWLLRPDVGARRMGVQAHRVMMTWLMHHQLSTADLTPTRWEDFRREYASAKVFSSQNIVRASTPFRFTCFSWSDGLKSYTGYIAPHHSTVCSAAPPLSSPAPNLIVPFRANNTGNFVGWYDVEGRKTNAVPVGIMENGKLKMEDSAWLMNGELQTNDGALNNRFAIYSTPGNAVVYIDYVRANANATILREKGGLMAISTDEMTSLQRTLYTSNGSCRLDGNTLTTFDSPWLNVDNAFGIIKPQCSEHFAFGEKGYNNSVGTAKLYASYSDQRRTLHQGDVAGRRAVIWYASVDTTTTARLAAACQQLETPDGWNAVLVADPDQTVYLLVSNFAGQSTCQLAPLHTPLGTPVLSVRPDESYTIEQNHSHVEVVKFFISDTTSEQSNTGDATSFIAVQEQGNHDAIIVRPILDSNHKRQTSITVRAVTPVGITEKKLSLRHRPVRLSLKDNRIVADKVR